LTLDASGAKGQWFESYRAYQTHRYKSIDDEEAHLPVRVLNTAGTASFGKRSLTITNFRNL